MISQCVYVVMKMNIAIKLSPRTCQSLSAMSGNKSLYALAFHRRDAGSTLLKGPRNGKLGRV